MDSSDPPPISLFVRDETLAIVRLGPGAAWPRADGFFALVRTEAELTVVCRAEVAPPGGRIDAGWRALQTRGTLDLALTGVLAGLASVLAARGIAVFAISTFDTDVLLVRHERLDDAVFALREAGYAVAGAK